MIDFEKFILEPEEIKYKKIFMIGEFMGMARCS
jgi:hypothetical protein